MLVYYNGQLIEEQSVNISIFDRGFQYGDGIFETIVVRNNRIYFINDHWQRLIVGSDVLKLNFPSYFDLNYLILKIQVILSQNKLTNARIKLIIWRGLGGFYEPTSFESNILIFSQPLLSALITQKRQIKVCKNVHLVPSILSNIKTINALVYVLAGLEKKALGCDDVLLTDAELNIGELSSSNIFFIKGDRILTPALTTGILPGVMRKQIVNAANILGFRLLETNINLNDLHQFDGAFSTNVAGFSTIGQIEDFVFSDLITNTTLNKFIDHFELI